VLSLWWCWFVEGAPLGAQDPEVDTESVGCRWSDRFKLDEPVGTLDVADPRDLSVSSALPALAISTRSRMVGAQHLMRSLSFVRR
jgi:hypothetical protein